MFRFSFSIAKKCSLHRNHKTVIRQSKFGISNSSPPPSNFLFKKQNKNTPLKNNHQNPTQDKIDNSSPTPSNFILKKQTKNTPEQKNYQNTTQDKIDTKIEEITNNFETFETSPFFQTLLSFKELEEKDLMKIFVAEKQNYRGTDDPSASQEIRNENEENFLRFSDNYLKFLLIEYTQENFQAKTKIIIKGRNFLEEIKVYEKMENMKRIVPFFSLIFLMELGVINYERTYLATLNMKKLVQILQVDKILIDLLAFNYTNNICDNILTRSTFLDRFFILVNFGDDLKLFRSSFRIMSELILFVNFNESLCGRIINSIIFHSNTYPIFINENLQLIITIVDKLTQKIANVSDKIQIKLAYLLSKYNFFGFNFKITFNFWNKTKVKIGKDYFFLTDIEKKSILFSMGKAGFIDEGLINKIFLHDVKFLAERSKINETNCHDVAKDKFINLIKSGTNLKIYNKEHINVLLNILSKDLKDFKIYYAISHHLIKGQFFHLQFWKEFFDNLEQRINEKLSTSQFFEVFTTLRIFKFYEHKILKYEGPDKTEFSDVLRLFKSASKNMNIRNFIEKELGFDKPLENIVNSSASLFEWAIEKILVALAVHFVKEYKSKK